MWHATILTIFPEMFPGPLGTSLAGKALAAGIWRLDALDIRDHASDRHRTVDDTPAGGGPGMVMKADVVARAIDAALAPDDKRPRLLMSPRGKPAIKRGFAITDAAADLLKGQIVAPAAPPNFERVGLEAQKLSRCARVVCRVVLENSGHLSCPR